MSQYKLNLSPEEITQRIHRLHKLYRMSGLSKKEFAQLLGRSTRQVHFWEAGKTPISERNATSIINALKKIGIICSRDWLLFGKNNEPVRGIDEFCMSGQKDEPFEHFNLDFSLSGLLSFYKRIYPDYASYFIEDYRYAPRIIPTTLLIATMLPYEKFKENWPHGYLYHLNDRQIIPIDIQQQQDQLYGTPFAQPPYHAEPFLIPKGQKLYPIINIRPVY